MADKPWKQFERWIAKEVGGERRGADFTDPFGRGKSDVILDGWSIECKLLKSPGWSHCEKAWKQASLSAHISSHKNPKPTEIPVAFTAKVGSPYKNSTATIKLKDFLFQFIGVDHPNCRDSFVHLKADEFISLLRQSNVESLNRLLVEMQDHLNVTT